MKPLITFAGAALPVTTPQQVYAIRACAMGNATSEQAKEAIDWIMERASDAYSPSMDAENMHKTAYNEGRRAVGVMIRDIVHMPPAILKQYIDQFNQRKEIVK